MGRNDMGAVTEHGERIARLEGTSEHLATKADLANLRTWFIVIVVGSNFTFEILIPKLLGWG